MILHTAARVLGRTGRRRHLTQARFRRIPARLDTIFFSTEQLCDTEDFEAYKWTYGPPPGQLLRWTVFEHYIGGFNPELSGQVIFTDIGDLPSAGRLIAWTLMASRVLYVPAHLLKNENDVLYVKEWPQARRVRVVADDKLVVRELVAGSAEETIIRRS